MKVDVLILSRICDRGTGFGIPRSLCAAFANPVKTAFHQIGSTLGGPALASFDHFFTAVEAIALVTAPKIELPSPIESPLRKSLFRLSGERLELKVVPTLPLKVPPSAR